MGYLLILLFLWIGENKPTTLTILLTLCLNVGLPSEFSPCIIYIPVDILAQMQFVHIIFVVLRSS